ncbi:hypothetical protein BDF22DRAFT_770673 [Syncephalis plumigaleata]|nr:hypothetical protein BDF22DRAFT_770673 [Syncephalis plumigaleata]
MDPNAVYRQHSSEPGAMGEGIQQSHYLPMEPPVGSQPVLGYNVGYVPSQVGGDAASMYGYTGQVPMQPMMQPGGDASASFPTVSVASSSSQGRNKPAKRKQVKNACVNCQKACKKCDDGRPCQRCIKYNLTETCVNSPRKERKKGIKRGPYKRRQKMEHDSDTGHGTQITGNEEEAPSFTGNLVMGNIPGVGIPGQNLPPQDISYYQAYYPTQQPMIYDPNQLSQAQPANYYYMSAPPQHQPPTHQSHQLHAGVTGIEQQQQQQQQQQQPQQISILPQQAPPPAGYYYPQYYQAPPPPPPQLAQYSDKSIGFSIRNTSAADSGLQHTAAVMIAPVIALSPTTVYKRRDSKIDILSELCTAVLDRDKQRDYPNDDSDVSIADDHDEHMDWIPSQYKPTKVMASSSSFNDDKSALLLNDRCKSIIDNEEKTNALWDRHTTPPPSPKLAYYRRASSVDAICDKERSNNNTRSSSQLSLDKSTTTTTTTITAPITSPILSSQYNNSSNSNNSNNGYYRHRRRRPSTLPILNGLSAFGIMTPEHSPTEVNFPEFHTSMNELSSTSTTSSTIVKQGDHINSSLNTVANTMTNDDDDDDHASLLPSNWPSLLPTPDCYGALSESDKVLDALLPQRRGSQSDMPMIVSQNDTSKQDLPCITATTTTTTTVMAESEPVAISNDNDGDDKEKESNGLSTSNMDTTLSNGEEEDDEAEADDHHNHFTETLLNPSSFNSDDKPC